YGEAMLKTQLAGGLLPLGCHWGQTHPIRERIEMLKQPLPTRRRRVLGSAIAAMLSLSVGYAAWAAQPQDAATKPADAGPHALQQAEVNAESRGLNPPDYPAEALKEGVVGTTVLVVDVDAEGGVSGLKIDRSSGDPRLDSAALEAASRWKFKPEIKGGKPVAGQVRVPVQFAMHEPSQPEADAGERPAQIIAAQPPKYPKDAAENRVEGRVMLIVDIAADGSVTGATVERSAGDASLDAAALEAVRQWRFQPGMKGGKAIAGKARMPIDFAMDKPDAAGDGAAGSDYYGRPAGACSRSAHGRRQASAAAPVPRPRRSSAWSRAAPRFRVTPRRASATRPTARSAARSWTWRRSGATSRRRAAVTCNPRPCAPTRRRFTRRRCWTAGCRRRPWWCGSWWAATAGSKARRCWRTAAASRRSPTRCWRR